MGRQILASERQIRFALRLSGSSFRYRSVAVDDSARCRQPQPQGLYPNHVWSMDFVSDALFDERRLRLLTVINLYTRECLHLLAILRY